MAAVAGTSQSASADSSDQLVVVDVASADSQDFSPSSLKTFNADGTNSFAKTVDLPSDDIVGSVNAFGLSGNSNGNGSLARSTDGNYLMVAGYHHKPGPTSTPPTSTKADPKDSKSSEIQRMVARIGNTGTVDTSTILASPIMSESAPRGVASVDGSTLYLSQNGGKDIPNAGVVKVDFGASNNKVAITNTTQKNNRQVQIAGGNLYTTSDKAPLLGFGKFDGAGLPTAPNTNVSQLAAITTVTAAPKPPSDFNVPDALVMLDLNSGVPGIDTAYVVIDTDTANGVAGEIRKYTTSDGTTWAQSGTAKTGDYPFLTGRVSGGNAQLFASKGTASGNSVVKFTDTGGSGAAAFGSETTIATAAEGHAFRGIALAPTGWNPGTISSDAPTASVADTKVGGTIGDAHNPGTTLSVEDADTDAGDLTVDAHSSDAAVIPDSGIHVTGSGADRAVTFDPTGVGRANITFTVTDDNNNDGTAQVSYAASATPESASGRYLYESSDLSSAIDVGDGYAIAVSSENNRIWLYKKSESNRPLKEFDFEDAGEVGSINADLESMARSGNTLYVMGSHGNSSSDGSLKPARDVMFTAAISGSGESTDLTFVAKRTGLRDVIKAWDVSHGNALGFAAGQADGKHANDPDGFNIEGFELAPGSATTGYLGFRSPIKDGKAVIVPITGLNPMLTGTPDFGDPIFLDLGGRSIREIRKNSDDEYLISAQLGSASPEWKLFAWDGNPDHKAVGVKDLPEPDAHRTGAWESIVSVPHPLTSGGSTTLITDSGDTTYYGDTTVGTDESKSFRKSYIDDFTTDSFASYPDAFAAPTNLHSTSSTTTSVTLSWNKVTGATGYILSQGKGSDPRTEQTVGDVSTATFSGLTANTAYTYDIKAKSGATKSAASTPRITVTTPAVPNDRPTDVHLNSRTASGLTVGWTKYPGAVKYKVKYYPTGHSDQEKNVTLGDVDVISITGLLRNASYTVRVAGVSSGGTQGPYSALKNFTTSNLLPPTNFAKVKTSATGMTVSWTPAAGAEGYRIYYGIGSGPRTAVEVSGGTKTSKQITGLQPNTTYTLDIASLENSGTSRSDYTTPRISIKTKAS
jgi:hypothetical protein